MKSKIFTFLGSNVVSQLILLIAVPLTGKIYSDLEIGVMSFVLSVSAPLSYFFTMSYNKAIMLPKEKEEYNLLYGTSIIFSTVLTILTFILIVVFFLIFNIRLYVLAIPIVAYSQSIFTATKDLLIKAGLLHILSIAMIINSIISVLIIFLGMYIKLSYWILLLSYLVPNIFTTLFLLFFLDLQKSVFTKNSIRTTIVKYKSFPLHQMPAYFINTLNAEMPSFFIKLYFGEAVLGNYFLASKIVNKPLSLISESLNGLIYKDLSETDKEKLNKKMNFYVGILFLITLLFSILYLFFGEYLFTLFFDIIKWKKAFQLSKIIIFTTVISASFSHYSSGILVKRKNKLFLIWELTTTALLFISFMFGSSTTIDVFIWIYVCVILFRYLFLSFLFNKS